MKDRETSCPTCSSGGITFCGRNRKRHTENVKILISLLAIPNVDAPDARWVADALQFYREKNSDFGDALLCAFACSGGHGVATFDKGLVKKFHEVAAFAPSDWLSSKGRQQGSDDPN